MSSKRVILDDPAELPASDWIKSLLELPDVELPNVIIFLINHGWSHAMVNDWKKTDGYRLFQDNHISSVSILRWGSLQSTGATWEFINNDKPASNWFISIGAHECLSCR